MITPSVAPALFFTLASAAIFGSAAVASSDERVFAAVFPFGTNERLAWNLIVENGGELVDTTALSNIVIVSGPAGIQERLRMAGAIIFIKAAGGCGPRNQETL